MTALLIADLRARPAFADTVAQHIWATFWRHRDVPFDEIRAGFARHMETDGMPFTLVAEREGMLCGTVSVIASDEPARLDLTPWIAALWVDEAARGRGVARALLEDAATRCRALGVETLFLTARPALRDFYDRLGWRMVDDGIGPARLVIMERML
ncbi:GNAT family N-acetyltransferase [Ferrovibrio sp.]|uniref:GNAT family N-acetyltransferase n=1 Tax=Ferrovibrio sp. TaxID=1917215 RepID=UPI00262EBD15|nr:GNAT family N-acetyltransferase [Ferrovibrio sp.]